MSVMRATKSYQHNAICDICGFKFKNFELKKRWDGYMVCRNDYEMRHPMDFYTTKNDTHVLPWTRSDSNGTDVSPFSHSVNWALASNGATATSSTNYPSYLPSKAINGELTGSAGNYWNDNTGGSYPDWLQVTFAQVSPVNLIKIYCLQDNFTSPIAPYEGMVGTKYVLTHITIQAWLNNNWETVATVVNNNKIIINAAFGEVYTDKVRVLVNASKDNLYSRIVELEAYGIYGGTETTAIAGRAIAGVAISGRD